MSSELRLCSTNAAQRGKKGPIAVSLATANSTFRFGSNEFQNFAQQLPLVMVTRSSPFIFNYLSLERSRNVGRPCSSPLPLRCRFFPLMKASLSLSEAWPKVTQFIV